MSDSPSTWSIEYDVREDAPSMFVPAALLPDAQPGDTVEMRSTEPPAVRRGRVVDRLDDNVRGEFFTVNLDETNTTSVS